MKPDGFVDVQVNGYRGVDFSSPHLTVDDVLRVVRELARRGTAAFCPTVTTSPLPVYERVLPVLAEAMSRPETQGRLLGIHLEGPFVNPAPGAVGVHPAQHVRLPDPECLETLWKLAGGKIALLTLAPEMPGAAALIRRARELGAAVSVGHTLCGTEDVAEAVRCGATMSTHLGNGCPNLLDRHRNPIWAQLDSPLAAMVIADGEHLPEPVLRSIIRIKGGDKILVTSDASPVAGLQPGVYQAFGHDVRVMPSGRIENCEAPTLAGSGVTLMDCMNVLARSGLHDEAFLWQTGFYNPLSAIGRTEADVAPLGEHGVVWSGKAFVFRSEAGCGQSSKCMEKRT